MIKPIITPITLTEFILCSLWRTPCKDLHDVDDTFILNFKTMIFSFIG